MLVLVLVADLLCQGLLAYTAQGRMYSNVEATLTQKVGLIPGCSEYVSGGRKNLFFQYRIDAAVRLYHAGKIRYILVSGDNRTLHYNEPMAMTAALHRLGVPLASIYRDYAGFRTLDTVVRAKKVFGLPSFTIISQPFHNRRALFIAHAHGINAIAFNAQDVTFHRAPKTFLREQLAVMMAVLDVYVFKTRPHFLGKMIVIGESHQ